MPKPLIGTDPDQVPVNGYLGRMAYQDPASIKITGGTATFTDASVISANSASAALRITQTGSGNALVVEDSANPDATPFVVNASGVVIVGNTSTQGTVPLGDGAGYTPQTQIQGIAFGTSGLSATLFNAAAAGGGGSLALNKSNTNTLGSQSVVASGDVLGTVFFNGSDGTNFVRGAQIQAVVDGTPGTNDMPGRLVFSTTADGASSPTERMRITSAGNVGIGTSSPTARLDLGSITHATPATGVTASLWNQAGNAFGLGVSANQLNYIAGTTAANAHVWYSNSIERMRISSAGNVGIGTASPGAALDISSTNFIRYTRFGTNSVFVYRRANGTEASPTTVASGESCFTRYDFYDGSSYIPGAQISAIVDGTPGTNDMPTRLGFFVTADGSSTVTEQMRLDNAGNLRFNSGYGSVATAYGCRAWVNFNGTGTPAIRASGNVSSITDINTGEYIVNITDALPDTNAFVVSQARSPGVANGVGQVDFSSVSALAVGTFNTANTRTDFTQVTVAVIR